jgi:hypothetical protein
MAPPFNGSRSSEPELKTAVGNPNEPHTCAIDGGFGAPTHFQPACHRPALRGNGQIRRWARCAMRRPIMCHNGPLSIHASRTTDCLVDVKTVGIVIEDGAKAVSISLGQRPRRVNPSGEDPRLYFSSFR